MGNAIPIGALANQAWDLGTSGNQAAGLSASI